MNLTSYTQNLQYQKTQTKLELNIKPVEQKPTIEQTQNNKEIEETLSEYPPIVFSNEIDLSDPQKFQKALMEQVLSSFNLDKPELFPNENMNYNKQSEGSNPYMQDNNKAMPQGFLYASNYEYYEKTTVDFNANLTVKTPSGEYNIDVKFSYSHEFYEKNETVVIAANERMQNNPLEISLDKDHDELKDLKNLHFVFDLIKQDEKEENDIFKEIKELLAKRHETMLESLEKSQEENEKLLDKQLDNFTLWQETSTQEMSLVAVKKDGFGIFLAQSYSQTSYMSLNVSSSDSQNQNANSEQTTQAIEE